MEDHLCLLVTACFMLGEEWRLAVSPNSGAVVRECISYAELRMVLKYATGLLLPRSTSTFARGRTSSLVIREKD